MQTEFEGIKQLLKSPMGLQPFNKEWKTILFTDYSDKGLGFALTQEYQEDNTKKAAHLLWVLLPVREAEASPCYLRGELGDSGRLRKVSLLAEGLSTFLGLH